MDRVPRSGVSGGVASGGLGLESHLLLRARRVAGTGIGDGELIVAGRIVRLQLDVVLEGRLGLSEFALGSQRHAEGEISLRKADVELGGTREVLHGRVPVSFAAGELAEDEFGGGVAGVDGQLFFEFLSAWSVGPESPAWSSAIWPRR